MISPLVSSARSSSAADVDVDVDVDVELSTKQFGVIGGGGKVGV
jgi:hypothetical protein